MWVKATWLNVQMGECSDNGITWTPTKVFTLYTQRYCIQDKKSPNFQDIRSPTHETPSLLPRHVNKDATSINDFTNKNLANKRQQVLFLVLFHTTILPYLHFCSWDSWKHCHSLLYSLNSYFFNLFLILICALTFFCNELFFFCRSRRMLPNHRSSWITFHQSYYWDLFVSKNGNFSSIQTKRWFHWYFGVIASSFFRIHALRQFFSCVQSLWPH